MNIKNKKLALISFVIMLQLLIGSMLFFGPSDSNESKVREYKKEQVELHEQNEVLRVTEAELKAQLADVQSKIQKNTMVWQGYQIVINDLMGF